jgi:hypothetical protein
LKSSARRCADVRVWANHHPIAALGAAAAAGFTAATALKSAIGSGRAAPQAASSREHDAAATNGACEPPARERGFFRTRRGSHSGAGKHSAPDRSVTAMLLASAFDLAKVAVEAAILATARRRQPPAESTCASSNP